jgi:hypothetical protein
MTASQDLEARLTQLLIEEAPPRAPERLVTATRSSVAATGQNRRTFPLDPRLASWILSPAGAIAAVAAVAVFAAALFATGRTGPSIGSGPSMPPPSGSPSLSPSPSPFACPRGNGTCLGPLEPGTYRSSTFLPTVGYTVRGGDWSNALDIHGQFDLSYATGQYTYPDGLTFHDGISIFDRPVAESTTAATPAAGVGTTADALAQWLVAHPALDASAPVPVTIDGGTGFRLTLTVPGGTNATSDHCANHREPRCVSLFIPGEGAGQYGFGLVGPETAEVFLLDTARGDTVLVVIDDVDGVDQPGLLAAAIPIVNSLSFTP